MQMILCAVFEQPRGSSFVLEVLQNVKAPDR